MIYIILTRRLAAARALPDESGEYSKSYDYDMAAYPYGIGAGVPGKIAAFADVGQAVEFARLHLWNEDWVVAELGTLWNLTREYAHNNRTDLGKVIV